MAMDKEQLLQASSLLHGKLRDRRDDIKKELIKLSLSHCEDEFTEDEVIAVCDSEFDVQLNPTTVTHIFDELDGDLIDEVSDGRYQLRSEISYEDFDEIIEPVWNEFEPQLRHFTDKVDPYYTSQIKPAFTEFFREFFLEITESVEELNEYQKDTIYTNYGRTDDLIDDIIARHSVTDSQIFRDAIRDYLYDPGDELLEFTASVYTTAVNVDLLSKEDELVEFPSIPQNNRRLVLDTNVLISLLADSHEHHHIASALCERSSELDFELYYLEETESELERYIEWTEHEMSGLVPEDVGFNESRNAFVDDFGKNPDANWEDYLEDLKDWKETIEEEFGIERYNADSSPNPVIEANVKELLVGRDDEINERHIRRWDHDAAILGIIARERQHSELSFGPFVLTFHNVLTQISHGFSEDQEIRAITGNQPLALHPRSWLNYVIAFTPVELNTDDRNQLSLAILRSASDFDESMDIDEYVHSLAPKVGLEKEDEESLKGLLVRHPLSDDLEDAIERDEHYKAEQVTREILTDQEYLETIQEEREFDERIQSASSRVQELEEEIERLEDELEEQESRSGTSSEGDVTIGEVASPEKEEFLTEYDALIGKFKSVFPGNLQDSSWPEPPDRDSNIYSIKNWLETTLGIITNSEDPPAEIERMKSDFESLLVDSIILSED